MLTISETPTNPDYVRLGKNPTFRNEFVKELAPGCTKSNKYNGYYEDERGRLFRLKLTNDWIKRNPSEYKRGLIFFYREEHERLLEENGYYLVVVFQTPSGKSVFRLDPADLQVNEMQVSKAWVSVVSKAL